MQFAFIMYHYYRAYGVYNEIRVFVSAYVWMTGFGNFLYFEKKQDFSLDRMISMWLRINYFPLLLSFFLGVPLKLYYVVPLHTAGFFITMATCYVAKLFQDHLGFGYWKKNLAALAICTLVHVAFFETSLANVLELIDHEYYFRFSSDKYTALIGIASGMIWKNLGAFMQYAHSGVDDDGEKLAARYVQRAVGPGLIWLWYSLFGYIEDKYTYNPYHPYVFWIPVVGWLMIRNSSKYLTEVHCRVMEFFGKITLETYVLQFHVFMTKNVQHIPIVLPGADDGPMILRTANMLLCGVIFVGMAYWARSVTVKTQETIVELMSLLRQNDSSNDQDETNNDEETKGLVELTDVKV